MPRGPVTRIRHLAVAVPDFEEAVAFYEDAWGLKKVEQDTGVAFFAAEGSPEQYILRIRRADEKRTDLIALGADDADAVDQLAAELAAAGFRFVSEPGALKTPGGGYGFRFFDPDGRVVEISSDVAERPYREIEEREAIPVKLSHIGLGSTHLEEALSLYQDKLGFKVSDMILGGGTFMRCSTDHHGFVIGPGKEAKLNHVAFEMRGIDEQMRASGRLLERGTPWRSLVVRHNVGDNVSSYFFDPNGNVSEFTAEIEQMPLDGARAPRVVRSEDNELWGVGRRIDPDQVPENSLTRETGHWVAPPI